MTAPQNGVFDAGNPNSKNTSVGYKCNLRSAIFLVN